MTDERDVLDRLATAFPAPEPSFERFTRRRQRKRRNQRIASALVAIVVATVAIGWVVTEFAGRRTQPAHETLTPTPSPDRETPTPSPDRQTPAPGGAATSPKVIWTSSIPGLPSDARVFDLSPDGKTIAFATGGTTTASRIGTIRMDGSGLRFVTDPAIGGNSPAWSPDGSQIALTTSGRASGIAVMAADGSGLRQLTVGGHDPTWSPDGARLAYWQESGDGSVFRPRIYAVDVQGGSPSLLGRGWQPDWSPDGTRIAFVQVAHHSFGIMHADGSGRVQLYGSPGSDHADLSLVVAGRTDDRVRRPDVGSELCRAGIRDRCGYRR